MANQIKKLIPEVISGSTRLITAEGFEVDGTATPAQMTGSQYYTGIDADGNTGTAAKGIYSPNLIAGFLLRDGVGISEFGTPDGTFTDLTGCLTSDPDVGRSYAEISYTAPDGSAMTEAAVYVESSGAVAHMGTGDEPYLGWATALMAALPFLEKDTAEFSVVEGYVTNMCGGDDPGTFPHIKEVVGDNFARMGLNVRSRLESGNFKFACETAKGTAAFTEITDATLSAYVPSSKLEVLGNKDFELLTKGGGKDATAPADALANRESFLKDFVLDPERARTPEEKELIPELPDWYEVPGEAITMAKLVTSTTGKIRPMRNILLKGPAGTGKTGMAQALASALHLPYTHITCDAGMELFNLTGTLLPKTEEFQGKGKETGVTPEDVYFDPADAYERITGKTAPEGISEQEVMELLFDSQQNSKDQDFVFVESELIKAIRNGWVVEVQEPTVILQPGVLPGLNSLLEGGSITLQTGETVKRHPDSVIVFTTNTDYEGCRPLNESVLDRFPIKFEIDMPDDEELAARAQKVTGLEDHKTVLDCIKAVKETAEYLEGQGIGTGNCGPRTTYDWIDAISVGIEPLAAAEFTLIAACGNDRDAEDFVRENILPKYF